MGRGDTLARQPTMIAPSLAELVEEIRDLVEEPVDRADPRAEGVRCALEAARSLLVGRPGHGPVATEMDELRRGLAAARAAVAAATDVGVRAP